jgi:hypothetical protein
MSLRGERGQSAILAVLFLTALLGMTAAVLDVGSWFRSQRATQAVADAAALAGAQALPNDPAGAISLALDYADRNGQSLPPSAITLSSTVTANDTITIAAQRPAPGFFANLFGIDSVTVGAKAAARAFRPDEMRWVAPITVNILHPKLSGGGCPCYGPTNTTSLPLGKTGAPGAFDMLNLDLNPKGTTGTSTLADWIENGFDQYLPLGGYYSDPGAKFSSSAIQQALDDRMQTELLFPVYDTLTGSGSNATYHIIAWVGFHLTGFEAQGNTGSLTGRFTRVIWDGIEAVSGGTTGPDLGVRSVRLVK